MTFFKLFPLWLVVAFASGCEGIKFVDNLKNADSNFWIKMILTILLLLGLQYMMKKFRR